VHKVTGAACKPYLFPDPNSGEDAEASDSELSDVDLDILEENV